MQEYFAQRLGGQVAKGIFVREKLRGKILNLTTRYMLMLLATTEVVVRSQRRKRQD